MTRMSNQPSVFVFSWNANSMSSLLTVPRLRRAALGKRRLRGLCLRGHHRADRVWRIAGWVD